MCCLGNRRPLPLQSVTLEQRRLAELLDYFFRFG